MIDYHIKAKYSRKGPWCMFLHMYNSYSYVITITILNKIYIRINSSLMYTNIIYSQLWFWYETHYFDMTRVIKCMYTI